MNYKILLLTTFIFNHYLSAQPLVKLPQKGFRQGIMYVGNIYDKPYDRSIRYLRDTMLCGKLYSGYSDESDPGVMRHFTRYDNGKVYLLYSCGNEVLQYDFNLQLKDTFIRKGWIDELYVVDSIDAFYLPGYKLRKYIGLRSHSGRYIEWMDGIGDLNNGLIYLEDFEGGHDELTCYKEYNTILYSNATDYNCDLLLKPMQSSNINPLSEEGFTLFPNPASDVLTVSLRQKGIYSLSISNALGQTHISFLQFADRKSLSLENFKPGIYQISVWNEETVWTQKFIVSD